MIKPLRNIVVIRPSEAQQENKIGLIIQSQSNNEGRVVALGPECKELKLGDVVRYDSSSVKKIEGYLVCRELDIFCVVE